VGEGSVTSKAMTMKAAIDEHQRYLVGKDPTDRPPDETLIEEVKKIAAAK